MLQYADSSTCSTRDAERLLLRALEQHAEAHARPLGRTVSGAPIPCATDRAAARMRRIARRQRRRLLHRAHRQIEIAVGVGDGAEKRRRLREGRVDLERLLQRRNRRVVAAERIRRPAGAEVEVGVARAALERFAEQARRAAVVALVERRPGLGRRHLLADALGRAPNKVRRKPQHRNRRIARCWRRMMLREARSVPSGNAAGIARSARRGAERDYKCRGRLAALGRRLRWAGPIDCTTATAFRLKPEATQVMSETGELGEPANRRMRSL